MYHRDNCWLQIEQKCTFPYFLQNRFHINIIKGSGSNLSSISLLSEKSHVSKSSHASKGSLTSTVSNASKKSQVSKASKMSFRNQMSPALDKKLEHRVLDDIHEF